MRIAVDAMGGDYAPLEIVKGAVAAAQTYPDTTIILVGREEEVARELAQYPRLPNIEVVHAPDVVAMDEQPALALRRKKGTTSIGVATELVKQGEAEALVSAGSTGAQMAAALLILGRIRGIQRPAITTLYPSLNKPTVLLDVGANTDVEAETLLQFAVMGSIYAEKILGRPNPSVGLLNIGTEPNKGNDQAKAAFNLLSQSFLNFAGNVEARDLPQGVVDVLVCDGFVGNVVLKLSEGLATTIFQLLKQELTAGLRAKMGAALVAPGLKKLKNMLDYAEYGGAPLLGVKGVSIICHGSSKARAITNAIKVAKDCVAIRMVEQIEASVARIGKGEVEA
ncbi:MAG TPA: phosphate acyltransferase PlsX [Clostridia bacterium]|nr:phosphate acyltransferase PlsX [Clostridia bacterium]